MRTSIGVTGALLAGLCAACSDEGGSDGGVVADATPLQDAGGDGVARKMIGPGGGTVELSGTTVTIPAGALSAMQEIVVSVASNTSPSGYTAYSPVYSFGPEGLMFAVPVKVSISFSGGANPEFFWTLAGSTTTFERLASTVSGGAASADVTHFSRGFVGRAAAETDAGFADATVAEDAMPGQDAVTAADTGPADTGAGMDAAGAADSGVQECTALDPGSRAVTQVAVAENYPAATGGPIPDGTYVLIERIRYVGPGGNTSPQLGTYFQQLRFTGTNYETAFRLEAPGMVYGGELTATWTTNGSDFTVTVACPTSAAGRITTTLYSSDGIRLSIRQGGGMTGEMSIYEKQ
jgi:hypothetical protein